MDIIVLLKIFGSLAVIAFGYMFNGAIKDWFQRYQDARDVLKQQQSRERAANDRKKIAESLQRAREKLK